MLSYCETDLLKAVHRESKNWKLNKMLGSKRSVTPSLGDGRNKNKFSSVSLQGQASTSSGGPDPGSKYKKHHSASSIPGPTTNTFISLFCLFWVVVSIGWGLSKGYFLVQGYSFYEVRLWKKETECIGDHCCWFYYQWVRSWPPLHLLTEVVWRLESCCS